MGGPCLMVTNYLLFQVKMGKMKTSSPSRGSHKHQKRKSLRREASPPSTSLRRVQEAAPSSSRRLQEGGLRGFRKATHSIQGEGGKHNDVNL